MAGSLSATQGPLAVDVDVALRERNARGALCAFAAERLDFGVALRLMAERRERSENDKNAIMPND